MSGEKLSGDEPITTYQGRTSYVISNNNKIRYDLTFLGWVIEDFITFVPQNFVEIGSNDGNDADLVSENHHIKKENCYVFEPIPELCQEIIKNYPDFKTFNNAVSSTTGTQKFNVNLKNLGASSLLEKQRGDDYMKIDVECIDMKSVISQMNLNTIDLCKIDVEGSTLDVLESFGEFINRVKVFQIENEHQQSWKKQFTYDDVRNFLEKKEFIQIFFVLQRNSQSDSVWVRKDCIKT